jgi:hypothetical protein
MGMWHLLRCSFLTLFVLLMAVQVDVQAQTVSYTLKDANIPCLNKKFTVVAHIMLDSLEQVPTIGEGEVNTLFAELSMLFEPICASFKVCEFNYIPFYQFDTLFNIHIRNDMENRYFVPNQINVFFISLQTLVVSPCGFAEHMAIQDPQKGIIAVERRCLDVYTLAHNMGIYFGLYRTNETENGLELVDGSNCETAGDMICDTPADPFLAPTDPTVKVFDFSPYLSNPDKPCLFTGEGVDLNGEFHTPDTGNIMSWYTHCYCGFTKEQYIRMAENYLASTKRKW